MEHFVKNVKQYHNHKYSAIVLEFIKLVKTKKNIIFNPLLFTYRHEYLKIRLQGRSRVNRDLQGFFFYYGENICNMGHPTVNPNFAGLLS